MTLGYYVDMLTISHCNMTCQWNVALFLVSLFKIVASIKWNSQLNQNEKLETRNEIKSTQTKWKVKNKWEMFF